MAVETLADPSTVAWLEGEAARKILIHRSLAEACDKHPQLQSHGLRADQTLVLVPEQTKPKHSDEAFDKPAAFIESDLMPLNSGNIIVIGDALLTGSTAGTSLYIDGSLYSSDLTLDSETTILGSMVSPRVLTSPNSDVIVGGDLITNDRSVDFRNRSIVLNGRIRVNGQTINEGTLELKGESDSRFYGPVSARSLSGTRLAQATFYNNLDIATTGKLSGSSRIHVGSHLNVAGGDGKFEIQGRAKVSANTLSTYHLVTSGNARVRVADIGAIRHLKSSRASRVHVNNFDNEVLYRVLVTGSSTLISYGPLAPKNQFDRGIFARVEAPSTDGLAVVMAKRPVRVPRTPGVNVAQRDYRWLRRVS